MIHGNGVDGVTAPVLEVDDVSRTFGRRSIPLLARETLVCATDHVSFSIAPGEAFGLVGESGSGKTTIGRMIVRLTEPSSGRIRFEGRDISGLHGQDERAYRRKVQMVFQSPYASLNPRRRVRDVLREALAIHNLAEGAAADKKMAALMERVGLRSGMLDRYPHEFSSGQRQRIAIARALSVEPILVVADEPTSALDVSVQAQVLNLLRQLRVDLGLSVVLISHDLRAVAFLCDTVGVLYLGQLLELAPRRLLIDSPAHPYTRALFGSIPSIDRKGAAPRAPMGEIGDQVAERTGCVYAPRCELRRRLGNPDRCRSDKPQLRQFASGQMAACHFAEEGGS